MSTTLKKYIERSTINPVSPIVIEDFSIKQDVTSIPLVGKYYKNYEIPIGNAMLWLTENFSSTTEPDNPIKGQIWYKSDDEIIKVYNGTTWKDPVDINLQNLEDHITDTDNPHSVTKTQIGLPDVINALQLVADNNLNDLTNIPLARDNLDVYSKAYIDANFITNVDQAGDSLTLDGLTASQFVRSDIADDVLGVLTFKNVNGVIFDGGSSDLIRISNAKARIGALYSNPNDNFSIIAGSYVDGSNDKFATQGHGATKISSKYVDSNGSIKLSVAGIGNINDVITYSGTLELSTTGLTYNGVNVATESGFTLNGNIIPLTNQTADLGAANKQFEYVYTKNIHAYSAATSPVTTAELAFRDPADNSVKFSSKTDFKTWFSSTASVNELPRNYIDGYISSRKNASVVEISSGAAKSSANNIDINSSAIIGKDIGAVWATGGDSVLATGGRPAAVTLNSNSWYRLFIIMHTNGTVNAGIDTSATATNLLSASGYTYYRQVAWIRTNSSSQIEPFFQNNDDILWDIPKTDVTTTTTAVAALHTLTAPPDTTCSAMIGVTTYSTPPSSQVYGRVTPTRMTDVAATSTTNNIFSYVNSAFLDSNQQTLHVLLDTSSQIRSRFNQSGITLGINTMGYRYPRGKQ